MLARRFARIGVAVVALAAAVIVTAGPASAHYTDALHKHGWTDLTRMVNGVTHCNPDLGFGASMWVANPDLITTPLKPGTATQSVAFQATLEWYDFARAAWTDKVYSGGQSVYLWKSVAYYALANNSAMQVSWREIDTNRWAPKSISVNLPSGFYYRLHIYYYWYADSSRHEDVTNWCYA